MKVNDIVQEGLWDEIRAGYRAGKADYIRRQAEKLGITPIQAVQQAFAQPGAAQTATPSATQTAPYGTASGFKPSSINVQYGQTPPKTTVKPMSYSGAVKGTLGGAPSASTATISVPPTKSTPAAATGMPTTMSGGAPGVGNPKVDPTTGWPVGAQSWAAGSLPPRPGTTPTKAAKPRVSVRAATGPTTPATPAATPAAKTTAPTAADIIPSLKGLSRNEMNKLYVQLSNLVGTPVGAPKK